jgi:alpha-glucoside transport system permease protein
MFSDTMTKFAQVITALAGFGGVILLLFVLAGRTRGRLAKPITTAIVLGPAIILVTVGLVVPAVRTVYLSLRGPDGSQFVGAANYAWAFGTPTQQHVLVNTLLWIVVAPVATTGLGLAFALLADRVRGEVIYKSLIFMPMAISFVGASIIWRFVYDYRDPADPQIGLLSQTVIQLGWHDPPHWILDQPLNTFLLMVVLVWVQSGFAMVVLSAAIKGIPAEIVDAARVDGASGVALLREVTVPMIRGTLVVVLTTTMIITLKVFDIVRTMTGGNFGTQVLANEMYSQSFAEYNYGRGSALAVILFAGVLPMIAYNLTHLRRERALR